ncbi:MAG: hypothetical protein QOJ45_1330 [Verrucomicrobiota bacterium]
MKTASDEIVAGARQSQAISIDHDDAVENDRDLLLGRPRPIANRRGCKHNQGDAKNPGATFLYGWPQCGQTALPSIRFFWQCGHGTRLPFGRVTR